MLHQMHVLSAALGFVFSSPLSAHAFPVPRSLHPRQSQNGGQPAGGNGNPGSIQKEIWIPLVVIAALFVVGAALACSGRRWRRGMLLSWGNSAAQVAGISTGAVGPTTQLTADQLAGATAVTAATTTEAARGTTANAEGGRRPRRTRRTPSQMSTHSLPAYNKEPGEQEIIIVRGDESDDEIPATMPVVEEHGSETPHVSFDRSRTTYSPVPNPANNVPLLRVITQTSVESDDNSSVDRPSRHYQDDAPPYETVVLNDSPPRSPSPHGHQTAPAAFRAESNEQRPSMGSTRRRSMFSAIFNTRNSRADTPSSAASPEPRSSSGHTRDGSDPSFTSLSPRPHSRGLRHQPSLSSGSMLSLLRTKSNTSGIENLSSPSMISLHSISSPLVHTARKTELVYGKKGPTADQIRLLSNRESIARFGMPYGDEAVAHAASTSAIGLGPPPAFEDVAGSSTEPSSSHHPREDTPSSGLLSPGEEVDETHGNVTPSSEPVQNSGSALHALADAALELEQPTSIPADSATLGLPQVESPVEMSEELGTSTPSSSQPAAARLASSTAAAQTLSSRTGAASTPSTTSQAPPSAFKASYASTPAPGALPARAASRASSYMSYATAAESLHSPSAFDSQFDLAGYESAAESQARTPTNISAPPTPRMESQHAQEPTDSTITPER